MAPWLIAPPKGLAFSRRERAAQDDFKNCTISRAKRSDCNAVLLEYTRSL